MPLTTRTAVVADPAGTLLALDFDGTLAHVVDDPTRAYVHERSVALTRVLAKELGRRSISVNTIAPGFTLTEASLGLVEGAEQYGVDRGALRRSSQPEDVVGAALFLAGPDSSFITGQTLVVDGGRQFV